MPRPRPLPATLSPIGRQVLAQHAPLLLGCVRVSECALLLLPASLNGARRAALHRLAEAGGL